MDCTTAPGDRGLPGDEAVSIDDEATTEWLTTAQATKHLGISRSTLDRLAQQGHLQPHPHGRAFRWSVAELDAAVETWRVVPTRARPVDDGDAD